MLDLGQWCRLSHLEQTATNRNLCNFCTCAILATKIFFKRARDRNFLIQVLRIQTVQVLKKHHGRTGSSVLALSISYGLGQQ